MTYKIPCVILNATSSAITPATMQMAIMHSGVTWGMSKAQLYQMQYLILMNPITVKTEVSEIVVKDLLDAPQPATYMLGIPVEIDKDLPDTVVQLRWHGAVLFTIENLAIPLGFTE